MPKYLSYIAKLTPYLKEESNYPFEIVWAKSEGCVKFAAIVYIVRITMIVFVSCFVLSDHLEGKDKKNKADDNVISSKISCNKPIDCFQTPPHCQSILLNCNIKAEIKKPKESVTKTKDWEEYLLFLKKWGFVGLFFLWVGFEVRFYFVTRPGFPKNSNWFFIKCFVDEIRLGNEKTYLFVRPDSLWVWHFWFALTVSVLVGFSQGSVFWFFRSVWIYIILYYIKFYFFSQVVLQRFGKRFENEEALKKYIPNEMHCNTYMLTEKKINPIQKNLNYRNRKSMQSVLTRAAIFSLLNSNNKSEFLHFIFFSFYWLSPIWIGYVALFSPLLFHFLWPERANVSEVSWLLIPLLFWAFLVGYFLLKQLYSIRGIVEDDASNKEMMDLPISVYNYVREIRVVKRLHKENPISYAQVLYGVTFGLYILLLGVLLTSFGALK